MAMEDDRGAWWFSTASGLFRFTSPDKRFNLRLLPDFEVSRFFEDSVGDIWIAHWPKLARWERRSGVIHDESERLPSDARPGITAFAQDHGGTMWIGVSDGSLLRLIDGKFQRISASWSGHVNKLFADSKGRLWATSTESGLGLIYDPQSPDPQVRRFTRAHGLSADEVWSVTEDRLGRIYAGTSKGVDRVDPGRGAIMHYSTADGLVRGDIRSSLRDRNGDLWFASAHGVSRYKPSEDHAAIPARTRITALRIAGVPAPLSEFGEAQIGPLRVPSHQRSLQIDFAATDYRTEAPLRYQFRLDRQGHADAADGWQDPGMTSTVHLVDLAPGNFTFRVRALGSDGSSGEEATLKFSILQPLWQTWWFQLACAMAIAAIAWWIRTRRLEQQLTLERVRSHIAMDLHDDIGAGLSRISVLGEALKGRLRDGDAEVRKTLDDIVGSSRQLVSDMGEIVWSLDPSHDHIGDLASRLRAFGSDLLETRGVEWNVDAPVESLDCSVPPALRRQFYLVYREAIHNVAKHSGAKRAVLRLWLQDGHLWGELADDGCGIQSVHTRGAGIPSMRARVRQSGGEIEISPSAGGGTSVRIRIPCQNTHDHALP
jgi:signal transduction histidine kinase